MSLGKDLREITKAAKQEQKSLTDYQCNIFREDIENKMTEAAKEGKNEIIIFNHLDYKLYNFINNHKRNFRRDGIKVQRGVSDCFILKW